MQIATLLSHHGVPSGGGVRPSEKQIIAMPYTLTAFSGHHVLHCVTIDIFHVHDINVYLNIKMKKHDQVNS